MRPFQLEKAAREIKEFANKHDISPAEWELLMAEVQQGKIKIDLPNYTNVVLSVKQAFTLMSIFAEAEMSSFTETICIVPFKGELKQTILSAVEYADLKLKGNIPKDE